VPPQHLFRTQTDIFSSVVVFLIRSESFLWHFWSVVVLATCRTLSQLSLPLQSLNLDSSIFPLPSEKFFFGWYARFFLRSSFLLRPRSLFYEYSFPFPRFPLSASAPHPYFMTLGLFCLGFADPFAAEVLPIPVPPPLREERRLGRWPLPLLPLFPVRVLVPMKPLSVGKERSPLFPDRSCSPSKGPISFLRATTRRRLLSAFMLGKEICLL